ncbi:MAG: DUF2238 domain-containing protein [bacterium]
MMPRKQLAAWLLIFFAALIWSLITPHDYFTWFLEVVPALIAFVILASTFKIFPLTPLLYWLILAHAIVLMIGGHYTYAEVPLFNTIKEVFHQDRNNYDKVGHFMQGFVPAVVAREILIRKLHLSKQRWIFFLVVCICLAVSAFYELVEWWVAVATGDSAEAFLGTQGYAWDTQSDMMLALIGAIVSLVLLRRLHDKQLSPLNKKHGNSTV